jgi:hypothetical protein
MSEVSTLQFDRAEYVEPVAAQTCGNCQGALMDAYFEVNGHVICPNCAEKLRSDLNDGSRVMRVARAAGAGFGAAILGALLYYAVEAITGYELGLIAIVVGFGVGSAVRWGCNGRGGWAYQTLAMALTYLAIVSTYVPPVIKAINDRSETATAAAGTTAAPSAKTEVPASTTSESQEAAGRTPPSAASALVALVVFAAVMCAVPFLAGAQNIMGIVIIGIGLYEAWKINKRRMVSITGPHAIGTQVATSA